jgi:hypothetical protein
MEARGRDVLQEHGVVGVERHERIVGVMRVGGPSRQVRGRDAGELPDVERIEHRIEIGDRVLHRRLPRRERCRLEHELILPAGAAQRIVVSGRKDHVLAGCAKQGGGARSRFVENKIHGIAEAGFVVRDGESHHVARRQRRARSVSDIGKRGVDGRESAGAGRWGHGRPCKGFLRKGRNRKVVARRRKGIRDGQACNDRAVPVLRQAELVGVNHRARLEHDVGAAIPVRVQDEIVHRIGASARDNAIRDGFTGNYVFENFKFSSDGNGGTLIVDPPVQTASNGSVDQFVFAPTVGLTPVQHTITDFNVQLDTIDLRAFGQGVSASALIASATPLNSGQDTLITVDSNDSILLKNVHVASLHASDFTVHV